MGKASSAKKIARAARAGSTSGPSERREIGFPAVVGIIIVLGLFLVAWARTTRDAQPQPTLQDHWHSAYGVWDCVSGEFLSPFQSEFDPEGIHSHGDGLIHIHPFSDSVTGKRAKMEIFLDAMGAQITDDALELPGGQALSAGVECDGEPAIIQVARWNNAFVNVDGPPDEVITENGGDVVFLANGEAFTIARAPLGAEIPPPPTVDQLEATLGLTRDEAVEPPNTSSVPGPQDFGVETDPSSG